MENKTSTYTIRVDEDLKKAFEQAARALDRTGSQILRDSMRDYVKWYMANHAQQDLLTLKKGKK